MRCKNVLTKALIALPLLSTAVSAFGISFFSPGFEKLTGSSVMMVFTADSPKLVNVKIAVQNKDNTLTAIDSSTAFNVASGNFVNIKIPKDIQPGINYWYIAVDASDATHYATLGPFPINAMFANSNPNTSVTASSTDAPYQTDGGAGNEVASTTGTPTATASSGKPTPTTNKGSNTTNRSSLPTSTPNSSIDNVVQHQSSPISVGAIAGIAVGGVLCLAIISLTVWCCLFKKAVQVLTPTVSAALRPSNSNNDSSIPMTMNPTYSPSTTVNMPASSTPPAKAKPAPASPLTQPQSPLPPSYTQPQSPLLPSYTQPPVPTSPTPTPATVDYSFSTGTEHTYNYQNNYPPTSPQQHYQGYPSYPYPRNSNQPPQGMPYPSQDSMPIPEHFPEGGQPYPPLSPTAMNNNYNYAFQQQQQQQQQQQYPPYNPQQQQNWGSNYNPFGQPSTASDHNSFVYPPMAAAAGAAVVTGAESSKTQHNNNSAVVVDTPLSQKVEYDDKEYSQKPDSSVDHQQPVYHKPDDAAASTAQHSKPHEREI